MCALGETPGRGINRNPDVKNADLPSVAKLWTFCKSGYVDTPEVVTNAEARDVHAVIGKHGFLLARPGQALMRGLSQAQGE